MPWQLGQLGFSFIWYLCGRLSENWVWKRILMCDCLMSIPIYLHVRLCLTDAPCLCSGGIYHTHINEISQTEGTHADTLALMYERTLDRPLGSSLSAIDAKHHATGQVAAAPGSRSTAGQRTMCCPDTRWSGGHWRLAGWQPRKGGRAGGSKKEMRRLLEGE